MIKKNSTRFLEEKKNEASMAKAGRELETGDVAEHHHVCVAHRLESTAGKLFSKKAVS